MKSNGMHAIVIYALVHVMLSYLLEPLEFMLGVEARGSVLDDRARDTHLSPPFQRSLAPYQSGSDYECKEVEAKPYAHRLSIS